VLNSGLLLLICGLKLPDSGGLLLNSGALLFNFGALFLDGGLQLFICGLKLPNSGSLFLDGGLYGSELQEKDGKVEGGVGDVGFHVAARAAEATSHLSVQLSESSAQLNKTNTNNKLYTKVIIQK
jgi:hypothetical protein